MKVTVLLLLAVIGIATVNAGKAKGKGNDPCQKVSKYMRKCLKSGYKPAKMSEKDLEDCKVKGKKLKKRYQKKCSKGEANFLKSKCPPLCKVEPEVEPPKPIVDPPKPIVEPPKPVVEPPEIQVLPPRPCVKKSVADCTHFNHVYPGAQLETGYYNGITSFEACKNKCASLADCRAIVYIPKVSRCFVKGEGYKPLTKEWVPNRVSQSLEMSCLDECKV